MNNHKDIHIATFNLKGKNNNSFNFLCLIAEIKFKKFYDLWAFHNKYTNPTLLLSVERELFKKIEKVKIIWLKPISLLNLVTWLKPGVIDILWPMDKYQLPVALATGTIKKFNLALAKSKVYLAKANTSAYFIHLAKARCN